MSDLLVAGAGPVGMAVAIEAALAGLSVTVMDPRPGPIDKACGEGLMPSARSALDRLGVEVRGREFHGIRYLASGCASSTVSMAPSPATSRAPSSASSNEQGAVARFRHGSGLGVRRTELSDALARRADELGVRRLVRSASPPQVRDHLVVCGTERATWFVAADGLHSSTREALGLNAFGPRPGIASQRSGTAQRQRYGLRRHYTVAPWTDLVEVYWAPASSSRCRRARR